MLPRLLGAVAAGVDRALYVTALSRSERSRKASRAESLDHAQRLEALASIRALYDDQHLADVASFFPAPPLVVPRTTVVRRFGRGAEVVDLAWDSAYAPHADPVRGRYLAHVANGTASARLFTVPGARRPAVILVHGYLGGTLSVEERFWPLRWLLRQGLDVALAVLPFHGTRRGAATRPAFPSSDPRFTNEGFRQAMHDLRSLMHILKERGAPRVGAMGMSLGGYAAALLATVEPTVDFAVPLVPLASLADFAADGGRFVGDAHERRTQHAALEAAHAVVSPLARPPLVPRDRIVVVGGEVDRITPVAHAEKLATHFGCRLEVFPGGHLLQAGRDEVFERIAPLFRVGRAT